MDYLEILGTLIGVIYLILEYRASAWLWIPSIAMPAIYLEVYYKAGLYADFGISIYYIIASVYGLICWIRKNKADAPLPITHTPGKVWGGIAAAFLAIFGVIGWILAEFTDSTVPWADAFSTALSIVAMWLLARKYIEQWLVWIAADVVCSALYAYKGLWFTSALYLAYAVIAVLGYYKWKKLLHNGKLNH